jgi:hypothetical protein
MLAVLALPDCPLDKGVRKFLNTDSHYSNECFKLRMLLNENLVTVVGTPSKCTHVLQALDHKSGLINMMKGCLGKLLKQQVNRTDQGQVKLNIPIFLRLAELAILQIAPAAATHSLEAVGWKKEGGELTYNPMAVVDPKKLVKDIVVAGVGAEVAVVCYSVPDGKERVYEIVLSAVVNA